MNVIAIIPAKKESQRCPNKNIRNFLNYPLFLYSVFYAQQEGVIPIVSTDSDEVTQICKDYNINVVREQVDDSTMSNCVKQVLQQVTCNLVVILMPTSPLRQRGLLRQMLATYENEQYLSAFTANPIKRIGQLDGVFQRDYRDQNAINKFLHFDGNISITTYEYFKHTGELFDPNAQPFTNAFPCTMQIDTEDEFFALEQLASAQTFNRLLPKNIKRICIVSNKPAFVRNYSDFVDSCDLVIRVSKMENLYSGFSGSRTDMAVVACSNQYVKYSEKAIKLDTLKKLPIIYFEPHFISLTKNFCRINSIKNWEFIPYTPNKLSWNFSTFGKAVVLANWLYPQAHIFCLGDDDVAIRTNNSKKHTSSQEMPFMDKLQKEGILTWILEENLTSNTGVYSTLTTNTQLKQTEINPYYIDTVVIRTVHVIHKGWDDHVIINGSVATRLNRKDIARVLSFNENLLHLKWEKYGEEKFYKQSDGSYLYQPEK